MSRLMMGALVLLGLAHVGFMYLPGDGDIELDPVSLQKQEESLDEELQNLKRFRREFHQIVAEVAYENLPLAHAVDQIENAARTYRPMYLKTVHLSEKGASAKTQIAHSLVRLLQNRNYAVDEWNRLHERLRKELVELCQANNEKLDF